MNRTLDDAINDIKTAKYGSEVRYALIAAFEHINKVIAVDRPTNCPNCGATVSGKSANCEYCGTLLIWR